MWNSSLKSVFTYGTNHNHGNHIRTSPNIGLEEEALTRLSESFTKFTNMSKKKKSFIATPDLVPWLPPGKTKEETFNSFAHKKNSGVYDLSASMQANDKIWSTNNSKKFSTDSSPWSIRWKKEWVLLREPLLWRGLAIVSMRRLPYVLTLGFWDFVLGPWNRLPEYFRRYYCLNEHIKAGMIPPA